MTNVRPVNPRATIRMIAAVPTTSPRSVSPICTGCVRKRWSAVSSVSTRNISAGVLGGHREAVGERRRSGQQDDIVLREAGSDLDVVQTDQPARHVPAPRPPAVERVHVTAFSVPEESGSGNREDSLALADHDLNVDRTVGRQRPILVGDLAQDLADFAAAGFAHAGGDVSDAPLPALLGQAVERDEEALAD